MTDSMVDNKHSFMFVLNEIEQLKDDIILSEEKNKRVQDKLDENEVHIRHLQEQVKALEDVNASSRLTNNDIGGEMSVLEIGCGDKENESGKFMKDTYSFMSLNSPCDRPLSFFFGFSVFASQFTFLMLILLNVLSPQLSTGREDLDNPIKTMFFPSNVPFIVRMTQYLAIITYTFFLGESIMDVVKAIEVMPNLNEARLLLLSNFLRFLQGILAVVVTVVLTITSSDIVEIVLNFAAINYISSFDKVAFGHARNGRYGIFLKDEANRIVNTDLPLSVVSKEPVHGFRSMIGILFLFMMASLVVIGWIQNNPGKVLTQTLRVQFKESNFEEYNGCYGIDSSFTSIMNRRVDYNDLRDATTRLAYCQDSHRWFFYKGEAGNGCPENSRVLAKSGRTDKYDVSSMFEGNWYSASGTLMELYFFEEMFLDYNKRPIEAGEDDYRCTAFLGNGICEAVFNRLEYEYDGGDCCSSTCTGWECGFGSMETPFGSNASIGDGFPNCIDPSMVSLTIVIEDVVNSSAYVNVTDEPEDLEYSFFMDPLMSLDCDYKNVFSVYINELMIKQMETVQVRDGADCKMSVRRGETFKGVHYTIYHGEDSSIQMEQGSTILDRNEDPYAAKIADETYEVNFKRVPECYFQKLSNHMDHLTMYTGASSGHHAINWLMNDAFRYSECEDPYFTQRYAASIVVSGGLVQGFSNLSYERQCMWPEVICAEGSIVGLTMSGLTGIIPTQLGILTGLRVLDFDETSLTGTIPTQIGFLTSLQELSLAYNNVTGTLPTQIGFLTLLEILDLCGNSLTGTIPTQINSLPSLKLCLDGNQFLSPAPSLSVVAPSISPDPSASPAPYAAT